VIRIEDLHTFNTPTWLLQFDLNFSLGLPPATTDCGWEEELALSLKKPKGRDEYTPKRICFLPSRIVSLWTDKSKKDHKAYGRQPADGDL
jgi:hypothetical protein